MGKKLKQLILIVGPLLYLLDLGSDIYVAVQYWKNDDVWWFGMTTGFILVPSIIVNITAIIEVFNFWRFIMVVLQLSFFVRYIEKISDPESIVFLRYLQTITESAPQLYLQVYIMLRQWDVPWYTAVSSVLSLLSLAWSIMKLEKKKMRKNLLKKKITRYILQSCF